MTNAIDHVIELNLGFRPEAAISGAVTVQTECSTFLTFNAMCPEPDGSFRDCRTAFIEFIRCIWTQFGLPNDEALPGHPLYAKGINTYGIFEVLNSTKIDQLAAQNRVAFPHTTHFESLRHFIFTFHDSCFECVAEKFTSELFTGPYEQLFARIAKRVLSE